MHKLNVLWECYLKKQPVAQCTWHNKKVCTGFILSYVYRKCISLWRQNIRVTDKWVSRWWLNIHFWVNYCFNKPQTGLFLHPSTSLFVYELFCQKHEGVRADETIAMEGLKESCYKWTVLFLISFMNYNETGESHFPLCVCCRLALPVSVRENMLISGMKHIHTHKQASMCLRSDTVYASYEFTQYEIYLCVYTHTYVFI